MPKMEDKEKKVQEMYMEFQMIDGQIKQLQNQLEMITHQLVELTVTGGSLDDFSKIKEGIEIFVPLSAGIFAMAKLMEKSELLVNVGANVAVKKDIPSTKALIQNQIEEIKRIQNQMMDELEKMTGKAAQMEMQLQGLMQQG